MISKNVDMLLKELVYLGKVKYWQQFEQFHALFECLRFTLMSLDDSIKSAPLSVLYPNALARLDKSNSASILNHEVEIRARTFEQSKSQLPRFSRAHCSTNLTKVLLMGKGNPGFDMAVPLTADTCLFIEARHSAPTASTTLSDRDVIRKRELIERYCEEVTGMRALLITSVDCAAFHFLFFLVRLARVVMIVCPEANRLRKMILVVAALRKSSILATEIPADTLVMDRAALLGLYGPTLEALARLAEVNEEFAARAATAGASSSPSTNAALPPVL